jgi:hypothetical protein
MDAEYYFYREEQAVEQFPDLVRVLGYSAAFEELRLVLSQDQLLHPEDVTDIAEEAAWRYFDGIRPA